MKKPCCQTKLRPPPSPPHYCACVWFPLAPADRCCSLLPQVVEYGGNLHGFGSKSVLGSGWPKEVLKVEGDTVTLSFEMRSGREHNTPDRALWGFKVSRVFKKLAGLTNIFL